MKMKLVMNDVEMGKLYDIVTNAIRESYTDDIKNEYITVNEEIVLPFEQWEFGDYCFDQVDKAVQQILKVFNAVDPCDI